MEGRADALIELKKSLASMSLSIEKRHCPYAGAVTFFTLCHMFASRPIATEGLSVLKSILDCSPGVVPEPLRCRYISRPSCFCSRYGLAKPDGFQ